MSVVEGGKPGVAAADTQPAPVPTSTYAWRVPHQQPPALLPHTLNHSIETIQLIVSSLQTFAGPLG